MDPNACHKALLEAVRDGDKEAIAQHADNLRQWISKGGFPPDFVPVSFELASNDAQLWMHFLYLLRKTALMPNTTRVLLKEALNHITSQPWDDSTCLHARISVALGLAPEYDPGIYGFNIDEIQREAEAS
jgi:hypothetical protein